MDKFIPIPTGTRDRGGLLSKLIRASERGEAIVLDRGAVNGGYYQQARLRGYRLHVRNDETSTTAWVTKHG